MRVAVAVQRYVTSNLNPARATVQIGTWLTE